MANKSLKNKKKLYTALKIGSGLLLAGSIFSATSTIALGVDFGKSLGANAKMYEDIKSSQEYIDYIDKAESEAYEEYKNGLITATELSRKLRQINSDKEMEDNYEEFLDENMQNEFETTQGDLQKSGGKFVLSYLAMGGLATATAVVAQTSGDIKRSIKREENPPQFDEFTM